MTPSGIWRIARGLSERCLIPSFAQSHCLVESDHISNSKGARLYVCTLQVRLGASVFQSMYTMNK